MIGPLLVVGMTVAAAHPPGPDAVDIDVVGDTVLVSRRAPLGRAPTAATASVARPQGCEEVADAGAVSTWRCAPLPSALAIVPGALPGTVVSVTTAAGTVRRVLTAQAAVDLAGAGVDGHGFVGLGVVHALADAVAVLSGVCLALGRGRVRPWGVGVAFVVGQVLALGVAMGLGVPALPILGSVALMALVGLATQVVVRDRAAVVPGAATSGVGVGAALGVLNGLAAAPALAVVAPTPQTVPGVLVGVAVASATVFAAATGLAALPARLGLAGWRWDWVGYGVGAVAVSWLLVGP
ncbi:MAG: hypothetical protein H6733_07525 [Alphaproteobacteria bacterium]|nr:hypothetical protein [Alphaproteobacteria bacterium]